MIIDFHTHMFPDKIAKRTMEHLENACQTKPYTNGTCAGLLASAEEAGIDISVVLPVVTKPSQYRSVTMFAAEYQEGKLLSFAGVHPQDPDAEKELCELKNMGFKGIKLHPDYQDTYFDDIRYKRIIERASELDMVVSVHAGVDPKCPNDVHCTPRMIEEVLDEVKPSRLVLAHFGGNELWDEVEERLIGRDVYLDTSVMLDAIQEEQFIRMVRKHGADKVLFATDSPWKSQKEFVKIMKGIGLTEAEKEQIFSGTARKLLGI